MCTKRVLKCTECYSYVVCAHAKHSHRTQYILYSIKVCIRSVKIFFLFLLLFLSFFLSVSLSFFTRFTRFVSLDRPRIVSSNSKRKKKRKKKKRKKINNSPKSTFFFLLSTVWWTQVIREKEKRLKSFHNYACVSYNQGQSWERTHIHSYTTRMMMLMMMMMIQFYIFNIDIWSFSFLLASLFHLWLLFLDVFSHVYNHVKLFYTQTHIYLYIVILLCLLSSPADSCLV